MNLLENIIIILSFLIISWIAYFKVRPLENSHPIKPYIIFYVNPTEDDEARCRADYPNCMDVMSTSALPSREDLPAHCYAEDGSFEPTDECVELLFKQTKGRSNGN